MIKNIFKNYILPKVLCESVGTDLLQKELIHIVNDYTDENSNTFKKLASQLVSFIKKEKIKEDLISSKKEVIIDIIKNIDDANELEKIISFLSRELIYEKTTAYIKQKFGHVGKNINNIISNIIIELDVSFDEKINFLNFLIKNNGIFSGSELLNKKTGNFKNFVKSKYNNVILDLIVDKLLNISGNLGFGPDQGIGEFAFVFLGKNIEFATKSDLLINNYKVEVKTARTSESTSKKGTKKLVGGRMTSTSGVSNPSSIKEFFYNLLEESGIPKEVLTENKNQLNLNAKGLDNLNNLISKYNIKRSKIIEIFVKTIKALFTFIDESVVKEKVENSINPDGTIKIQLFLLNYSLLVFLYYKQMENFDIMMIFNANSTNFIFIEDEKDIINNLNIIKFSSFLIWNESRVGSSSPQILIK